MSYYISFTEFSDQLPQRSSNIREIWDNLSEQERQDLFQEAHNAINENWAYHGSDINYPDAFPRKYYDNFSDIDNLGMYSQNQIDFMKRYNRKIPPQVRLAVIQIAGDIITGLEGENAAEIQRRTGAKRIKDGRVELEFFGIGGSEKIKSTTYRALRPFMKIYFAMMR